MKKKTQGITLHEFFNTKYSLPEGAAFLGAWDKPDVLFFVFEYKNGAKLRVTYWKPAAVVLVCVRDYYGNYYCLNSNVKNMEELTDIIENFDYRRFDAKKEKQATFQSFKPAGAKTPESKDEISDILRRLNNL